MTPVTKTKMTTVIRRGINSYHSPHNIMMEILRVLNEDDTVRLGS